MFGALYAKALELFGRGFLLASFIPTLIVTSAVFFSIDRFRFMAILKEWVRKDLNEKAAGALLLLVGVYLFAYVLYGVREGVTDVLYSGKLWVLPILRAWRRRHFQQVRLEHLERYGASLGIPQAAVWAESGEFPDPVPDAVVLQKGVTIERLVERAGGGLAQLETWKREDRLGRALDIEPGDVLARLLWYLHQLALRNRSALTPLVVRLHDLAKDATGGTYLLDWCRTIERRAYGDVVDAFQPLHAEPPEKDVQPTVLGNVLASGAAYPKQRYGIQAGHLHPRLAKVVDEGFQRRLDDSKTFLDFAVLSTVLCTFGGLSIAGWHLWPESFGRPWSPPPLSPHRALVILAWFVASHVFYRVAVAGARIYIVALSSAIDLFRLRLLDALDVAAPTTTEGETRIWQQLDVSFLDGAVPDVKFKSAKATAAGFE